tara:strand:- start:575 stop:1180 length:606 start_codon:yes stop_codon:yes gene_type:complete
MQKLLNEWRSFLAEAKKYTEDDVKAAIAKYKGKKVGVVKPFDFGEFLKEMAQAESRYNPYARSKSGTFIGAFQLGPDHHKGKLDVAYNPARAAAYLYDFFSKKMSGLYDANEHLETAVKQFGEPTLYYLAHNQGKAGAVRILYAAIGKEKKLSAGKLDNATLERMKGQNISMIKPFLDDPLLPNQEKAKAFINYFKGKYKF